MQTQLPLLPLSIPSEDSLPLFDPSGLSASLSADDWQDSFDLSSVAAIRLGIAAPASRDASPAASSNPSPFPGNLTRNSSRSGDIDQPESSSAAFDAKRGRRRRSSVDRGRANGNNDRVQPGSGRLHHAGMGSEASVRSKVRMWWQRGAASEEEEQDEANPEGTTEDPPLEASSVETVNGDGSGIASRRDSLHSRTLDGAVEERATASHSHGLERSLGPGLDTSGLALRTPAQPSSSARLSNQRGSPSPTVRSAAADFLSSFSSMHNVTSPTTSVDARSLSYSPPRAHQRSGLAGDGDRIASSPVDGTGSGWFGIGSAAAALYGQDVGGGGGNAPRPDEEGAKFGPHGRYLLGRTIGYGGFSTVKEGYDLEGQAQSDDGSSGGRVAVKIVYKQGEEVHGAAKRHAQWSHELDIWRSLPAHPHLLPLLHSEEVLLSQPSGSTVSTAASAELLVMPLCDRGNLLDYVRSEGGTRSLLLLSPLADSGRVTPLASSLSRSASLNASISNVTEGGQSMDSSRTGSGFLSRSHRRVGLGRVPSAPGLPLSATLPWALQASQLQSSAASIHSSPGSVVGSVSSGSGLLRRTSSQAARSRGVPMDAARETMRQLSSALYTLHVQAGVLHSDLKLENVLGQESRPKRGGNAASKSGIPSTSFEADDFGDLDVHAMPCWRIADFGLACRVKTSVPDGVAAHEGVPSGPPSPLAAPAYGPGGSLAYTAPESLREKPVPVSESVTGGSGPAENALTQAVSPFAADMWALGCILYALMSGRLPFADSFEPRLQMKIAKAQWEVPVRLRRRAERLTDASRGAFRHVRESSSGSYASADIGIGLADRPLSTLREGRQISPLGRLRAADQDMSASMPSLPAKEKPAARLLSLFEPPSTTPSTASNVRTSDHIVGSAPGRADHVDHLEINMSAKALADAEVDPESDDDEAIDREWDGLSWDRAAVRQVLHGLLEPDPAKRWTIERLCASPWIQDANRQDDDRVGPEAAISRAKRTSLVGQTISERPSQETMNIALDFKRRTSSRSRDTSTPDEGGRRSEVASTLAQSRPTEFLSQSSGPVSPRLPPPCSGPDDIQGVLGSRPASRDSLRHPGEPRQRSSALGEPLTQSRPEGAGWQGGHLPLDVVQWSAIGRCESPADSERRGRQSRSRMADLDENQTWSVEAEQSAAARYSDLRPARGDAAVPIPIRSQSHSRSRSRHSRESGSPDRLHRRSRSRPPALLAASFDSGGGAAFLRGRSFEASSGGALKADKTQAHRSSTSRSRSRAPDALAQILGRDRAASRASETPDETDPSFAAGRSSSSLNLLAAGGGSWGKRECTPPVAPGAPRDESTHEARGRARDRK
ncbi:hypothetical protein ACQY0O_004033 [Thecaphora frezii]